MTADIYPPKELQRLWGYESHKHPNPELFMRKRIAQWCVEQAVERIKGQWPEPITDRPPEEADADDKCHVAVINDCGTWAPDIMPNSALDPDSLVGSMLNPKPLPYSPAVIDAAIEAERARKDEPLPQWPAPIVCRRPTAEDADGLGYVQYLDDRGFWSIRYWYNVALHNQPWLHTLSFTMDRHA